MATIAQVTALSDFQAVTLPRTAMTTSDTLTYVQGSNQVLVMYNTTAGAINVTFTGSSAGTIAPAGYGGTISVAGGKVVTVPASSTVLLALDDISAYLQGTITITNGTGLTAHLFV